MESRRPGTGSGSVERAEPNLNPKVAQRLDPIDLFCPSASDDERALRRRIHRAQGASTSAATHSTHWRARTFFWSAAQMAGDWQFKHASAEDLKEIINGLSFLFLAARLVERVEAPDDAG